MKRALVAIFLMITLPPIGGSASAADPTPAPAANVPFALPLADGSTAQAAILPGPTGSAYLVYATARGQLAILPIGISPLPPPLPPAPPVPPVPPVPPQQLCIIILEDPLTTTLAQRAVLSCSTWRTLAQTQHRFLGVLPFNYADPDTGQPPAALLPYYEAATGKPLPLVILADQQNKTLFCGPLPPTCPDLCALIHKYGG